jgi:hypothetical protein
VPKVPSFTAAQLGIPVVTESKTTLTKTEVAWDDLGVVWES